MKLELVAKTEGVGKYKGLTSEEIVSAIARHGIIKEDNGKLIKYLMKEHHWSPLDMINFTFEVETSRAIGRQWLRHSSIRPQEHSQRYSDRVYFENIELRLEDKVNRQSSSESVANVLFSDLEVSGITQEWAEFALQGLELLKTIEDYYKKGIKLGVAKECMRSWLPECTTSTLTFNGTLRSWLSFLNVRLDHHSQKEILELAKLVGESLELEMPNVFAQIDWKNGMFM